MTNMGSMTVIRPQITGADEETSVDYHDQLPVTGRVDEVDEETDVTTLIAATKLDDLTAPDDNTDLDASVSKHGLFPKADKTKLDGMTANVHTITTTSGNIPVDFSNGPVQELTPSGAFTIDPTNFSNFGGRADNSYVDLLMKNTAGAVGNFTNWDKTSGTAPTGVAEWRIQIVLRADGETWEIHHGQEQS